MDKLKQLEKKIEARLKTIKTKEPYLEFDCGYVDALTWMLSELRKIEEPCSHDWYVNVDDQGNTTKVCKKCHERRTVGKIEVKK